MYNTSLQKEEEEDEYDVIHIVTGRTTDADALELVNEDNNNNNNKYVDTHRGCIIIIIMMMMSYTR